MTRIDGRLTTRMNRFGLDSPKERQPVETPTVGNQVQSTLFGRPKPPLMDPSQFPEIAEFMVRLNRIKRKLAFLSGDDDEDYLLCLADSTTAMIDEFGVIYLGVSFLKAYENQPEVVIGVLAHEIGHRPKRWDEYRTKKKLSQEELDALCRHEETRADIFAGKALAELGESCEPLVAFLEKIETKPHADYFPAAVRAEVIRQAHAERSYRADARKKHFPKQDRMTSAKGHVGDA